MSVTSPRHRWYPVYGGQTPHLYHTWEIEESQKKTQRRTSHISLAFSICWLSQSQLLSGCVGRCIGLSYLASLSLFIWPVLSLVLSEMLPPPPTTLADGFEKGHTGAGWSWPGTSCCPGDGRTVFLGLHPQRSYAGGFAVWIHVEIVAVDSTSHPGTPKQAPHVRLSHVAAAWTGHAQEIGHARGAVRVRGHARGDGVTGHNTARHRRRAAAASNPRRVLDLKRNSTWLLHGTYRGMKVAPHTTPPLR